MNLPRPFRRVPTRIIVLVVAATLLTSLVVTWVSVRSTHAFLAAKVEQKFPEILLAAAARLDLWYKQRAVDLAIFAHRDLVVENLAQLRASKARGERAPALSEIREFLSYVLERVPEAEQLLLLEPDGALLLSVGADFELGDAVRKQIARVSTASVSDVLVGDRGVQIASTRIEDARGQGLGSLHAVLRIASVQALLHSEGLGASGQICIVRGHLVLACGGATRQRRHMPNLPEPGDEPVVNDYMNGAGEHVVGSAMRLSRFGWSIAVEQLYDETFSPISASIWRVLGLNLLVVLLFSLVAYRLTLSIVRPIAALSEGARRISQGETDVVIPTPARDDEIGLLARTVNEMVARLNENRTELQQKNHELQKANEALAQLSITDELTGLHNHRFFQEHLAREVKRAKRTGESLSLIVIDLDDFKQLNDLWGHAAGDRILRRVAVTMNDVTRETDLLARYGGEEFALLASHTDLPGAGALAEKIRVAVADLEIAIEDAETGESIEVSITLSAGVSSYPGDRKRFFNEADAALYQAKRSGKDCVVVAKGDGDFTCPD